MMRLAVTQCPIAESECALVRDAVNAWHDQDLFPEPRVIEVKSLFRRLFQLPPETVLVGSALPDAVVLSSPPPEDSDLSTFYAVVLPSENQNGAFECMRLDTECAITFSTNVSFRDMLLFLNDSSYGPLLASECG